MNIIAAKAKKTILNIAPAGCGKSTATNITHLLLKDRAIKYTSLTLAGLKQIEGSLRNFDGHIIIDDLAADRSLWARISTVTVLANLVHDHYVKKVTQQYIMEIENFYGSVSINVQPVLMHALVSCDEWIAIMRDKIIRYYHVYRPIKPNSALPNVKLDWGQPITKVKPPKMRGKLWYQLIAIGLTQWSYARVIVHIPDMLKALAALDNRTEVTIKDYKLLIKLLKPIQLERYLVRTYGFEAGRTFDNNLYCTLVEIATFKEPTIEQICEDYKIAPQDALSILSQMTNYIAIIEDNHKRVKPKKALKEIMEVCGL